MNPRQLIFPNGTVSLELGSDSCSGLLLPAGRQADPATQTMVLVTDAQVAALYEIEMLQAWRTKGLVPRVHKIEPGESSKSIAELQRLYDLLAQAGVGRDGLLIAFGGGVVSDLTGFAASTWMRGIDWLAIPTTVEAMVDACVGGKTAINLPAGKNLVGTFHHPKAIGINPDYLATLPQRDIRAGLAESIKHALLFDEAFLRQHERDAQAILRLDSAVLLPLIERNILLKADIVRRDPFERTGDRMLLNFGHTIGHALEAASGFALRHGECVALGMLAECRLAERRGLLSAEIVQRVQAVLEQFGLPTRLEPDLDINAIFAYLRHDKKARTGRVRFILLRGIGQPETVSDVTEAEIRAAVESIL